MNIWLLESKLKRLGGKTDSIVTENAAASNEPRENYYGDFRNSGTFHFFLDNNGDILMLTEILFDR